MNKKDFIVGILVAIIVALMFPPVTNGDRYGCAEKFGNVLMFCKREKFKFIYARDFNFDYVQFSVWIIEFLIIIILAVIVYLNFVKDKNKDDDKL